MKNNKALIIIGVVFMNLLVVFMVGQNLMGKESKYDIALAEARELSQRELYSRAITGYQDAAAMEESVELYLEMIDTYRLGLESGEITSTYTVASSITKYLNNFQKEARLYEAICQLLMDYEELDKCVELLVQARDLKVYSELLTQFMEQLRFRYEYHYSMYSQVQPESGGMYVAEKNGTYSYLNSNGAAELDEGYVYATGFTEGYAYVQIMGLGEDVKHVIIDQEGVRQGYLYDIETSSGVGRGWDSQGETVLLLACKTGDVYSYYDTNGEKLFGEYAFAGRFRNNVAAVMEAEGKWRLIDSTGAYITDKTFTDVALNEMDECAPMGVIFACENGKYSMYGIDGQPVGEFTCDEARPFVDSYAAFRQGEAWGFVDTAGQVVIQPQYIEAKSFSNKLGLIKTEDGWSGIGEDNVTVIEETFDDMLYLSDSGICFVKEDDFWSFLEMYYTD